MGARLPDDGFDVVLCVFKTTLVSSHLCTPRGRVTPDQLRLVESGRLTLCSTNKLCLQRRDANARCAAAGETVRVEAGDVMNLVA